MSLVDNLVVINPVRIIALNWDKWAKICRTHWKFTVLLAWGHLNLHWVSALDIKDVVILLGVEEVGVLSGKYMEELIKALKVGRNHLHIDLAAMRIIVSRIDPCSHGYILPIRQVYAVNNVYEKCTNIHFGYW